MLSKRVMVVAPEKALQKRLAAAAMSAGGATQTFASLEEAPARVEAELVLLALPARTGPPLAPPPLKSLAARLPDESRLMVFIPAPDLEWTVALMSEPRVNAVLVADGLPHGTLTATLAKLLQRDLFGVDKLMPWGVRVYSAMIGDYQEKSQAITAIDDFAMAMGVRRKYREQIDQCVDEMLMNALYDAPVDDNGKPLFADVPVKERVLMRVDQKAIVQYACDGERFVVSVRDAFGTLRKETVLAYLDKCLHAPEGGQIDRKTGGAGLGLYLICNAATEVNFHVFEGSATEVACAFDLSAARSQLHALGVFEEHIEGAPRISPAPTRTVQTRRGRRREDIAPAPPRSGVLLPLMMVFSILLLAFAATLVGLPYLRHPAQASLRVESEPPGAMIYVDGRARGVAPLAVTALEAGRSYALRGTRAGYREDEQLVTATADEGVVRLRLVQLRAQVAIESDPPGARVTVDGQASGKLTPATLELEPEAHAKVTLDKEGFVTQELAVTAPAAGERAVFHAPLPLSPTTALLTIASEPASASVSVDGLVLSPPAPSHDTFVAPGARHKIKVSAPGFVDERQELAVAGGEHRTLKVALHEGGTLALKVNVPAKVSVDDKPIGTAPILPLGLPPGEHTLSLHGDKLSYSTPFSVDKGETLEVKLVFNRSDHTVSGHVGEHSVTGKW